MVNDGTSRNMKDLLPHDILEFDGFKWHVTEKVDMIRKVTNDANDLKEYRLDKKGEEKEVLVWGSKKLGLTNTYVYDDRKTTIFITPI